MNSVNSASLAVSTATSFTRHDGGSGLDRCMLPAPARNRRPHAQPGHEKGQHHLEDVVVANVGQLVPDRPDVRVVLAVNGPVGARPSRMVSLLQVGVHCQEGCLASCPCE